MILGLWRTFRARRLKEWPGTVTRWLVDRMIPLLAIQTPDAPQLLRRMSIEREIIVPIKVAGIAILAYFFYSKRWFGSNLTPLDNAVESITNFFPLYVAFNVAIAGVLMAMGRLPVAAVQWVVFVSCLLDGILVSSLTLISGGYDSYFYWLFPAMIVRGAMVVPRATSQLMLNVTLSACYVMAGVIDVFIRKNIEYVLNLGKVMREPISFTEVSTERLDSPAEPLLLRLVLLLLMTVCSYGVQVLLERQRQVEEESREFAVREGQLRSAGRMAAEFVHQIKNPLGIINNAAYSLGRAIREGRPGAVEQIQIIQEEVERSDRIITQIMDYAQLSEGRVEKLDVVEELDQAIERVFPPAAGYPVRVHRDYDGGFPPLLMQRRHVAETFMNLLQNARDALEKTGGNVHVQGRCTKDLTVEVIIRDDGPGIAADKLERVFEAYYTTKEKGTGLGLATVKHNVELYGGSVRLQSELGKGACFTLIFPGRTQFKLAAQT